MNQYVGNAYTGTSVQAGPCVHLGGCGGNAGACGGNACVGNAGACAGNGCAAKNPR